MTLYHLIRGGLPGDSFRVFEPRAQLGRGLAYGTDNPLHLLNVPACGMSALPDDSEHFVRWLGSTVGQRAAAGLGLPSSWLARDFVPRCLYAEYLFDLHHSALAEAESKGISVEHVQSAVSEVRVSADSSFAIQTVAGESYQSAQIVLALGNHPQAATCGNDPDEVLREVWHADSATLRDDPGPIAILGTGLTMVDTVLALRGAGYQGQIVAVSRHGLLPHVHACDGAGATVAKESAAAELAQVPNGLLTLLRTLRKESISCMKQGLSWQAAIDAWRPYLPSLWASLSIRDRRRFFARLFTIWNVHRHRMAPSVGQLMADNLHSGRLRILAGCPKIAVESGRHSLTVGHRDGNGAVQLFPTQIFDCRGMGYDVTRLPSPLLKQLLSARLLVPHQTGWGVEIDADFRAQGTAQRSPLFVIGSLAIGDRLETTAVPELRGQAAKIAARCLAVRSDSL